MGERQRRRRMAWNRAPSFCARVTGTDASAFTFHSLLSNNLSQTSKKLSNDRQVFLVIGKADVDKPWWPRLQKGDNKPSFLKTDFSRWKDEDEDSDESAAPGGMAGM
ncbi:MAG: hypothetical protein BJ554DRAFT_7692, partial [Olpidium bornovanus]